MNKDLSENANFHKFEKIIFTSADGFEIRKIKQNVILTYHESTGAKEYEDLAKGTFRLLLNNLELARLYPPDDYSSSWLLEIRLSEMTAQSIPVMSNVLVTLERIAQSETNSKLSQLIKEPGQTESISFKELQQRIRQISRAFTLLQQDYNQTTAWLANDGLRYEELIRKGSLRLFYENEEIVRLVPYGQVWKLKFVRNNFNAADGIIDDLVAALSLLEQFI